MKWKYLIALTFVNIVYLVVGGCIFYIIEHPQAAKGGKAAVKNLVDLEKEIQANFTCLNEEQIHQLVRRILNDYDSGTISLAEENPWTIDRAIFFASTVITTIGYGYTSPETTAGRIFCCFYALIGIPLCLTMLGGIGKKLNNLGIAMDNKLNHGIFTPNTGRSVRALILFILGFALFISVPAVIVKSVEGWSYGESVYYGVITLTTVGFGDFVPGKEEGKEYRWIYIISLTCWIMIGLAWAAAMIANLQELYHNIMYPEIIEGEVEEATEESKQDCNGVSTKEDIPLVTNSIPMYTEENHQPN